MTLTKEDEERVREIAYQVYNQESSKLSRYTIAADKLCTKLGRVPTREELRGLIKEIYDPN